MVLDNFGWHQTIYPWIGWSPAILLKTYKWIAREDHPPLLPLKTRRTRTRERIEWISDERRSLLSPGQVHVTFKFRVEPPPTAAPTANRTELEQWIISLPPVAYHVATLRDGDKVCLRKPGYKVDKPSEKHRYHDFEVFVYSDEDGGWSWPLKHAEICSAVRQLVERDRRAGERLVDVLDQVCRGAQPELVLSGLPESDGIGPSAELLLTVSMWIWGEEDCNYPLERHRGRQWSMSEIRRLISRV